MTHRLPFLVLFAIPACGGQASRPPEAAPASVAGAAPQSAPATASAAAEPAPATSPSAAPPERTAHVLATNASAAPTTAPPRPPLAEAMQGHARDTEAIRAAVIHGPLSAVSKHALALENLAGNAKTPPSWNEWAERVKSIAERIHSSPDVAAAAVATTDIGLTCGACHTSHHGGPHLEIGEPPQAGPALTEQMRRHSWASERLWEGIYAPSEAAWKAGASALIGAEFPPDVLKKGGVNARSAANDFKSIAGKAKDQKTPEARASLYASLLQTCATCHIAVRGGP